MVERSESESDSVNAVFEKQTAVLGALLNRACPLAKKVIGAYSPTVKYKVNLQNIKRHNGEHLEAAATLLGFNVRADSKKLYKNLSILSDRVLLKIESLFESTCLDCGEVYCNTLEDLPPLTCHLCLQGSHNCDKVKDKVKTPRPGGSVWLCFDCYKKNDLALMPTEVTKKGNWVVVDEEEDAKGEDEKEDDKDNRVSPRRFRDQEPKLDGSNDNVCEAYKKRECPHGLTGKRLVDGQPCQHKHPPRCFRWCKHGDNKKLGCTKGKECKYFHPKLCRNSVLKRFCGIKDCSFLHLKHTRRPKDANFRGNNPVAEKRKKGPKAQLRWDSLSTLNGTPYPVTVQKRSSATEPSNQPPPPKQEGNRSDDFLLERLENMKEGIVLLMTERLSAFQSSIPGLVREQIQNTRPTAQPTSSVQFPTQQRPPPLQTVPNQQPANFWPQFPGFFY